ncbi:MAG: hypothetical protein AAF633_19250 [Chloroflexota bacterium]
MSEIQAQELSALESELEHIEAPAPGEPAASLSVEEVPSIRLVHLLFLLLFVVFAILRMPNIGAFPLSPSESENGLAVWTYWQPMEEESVLPTLTISPAYFSLTVLSSQVFGFETWSMRLIPLLASFVTVMTLWMYRRVFGWVTILTVGFLLSVSPPHLFVSREAGGIALAVMATLGLLGAWLNFRNDRSRRSLFWAAGFLGFGLTTDPLFLTGLVILILTQALEYYVGPPFIPYTRNPDRDSDSEEDLDDESANSNDEADAEETDLDTSVESQRFIEQDDLRRAGIVLGIVFLASSTLFLWNLAGLGETFNLFALWVERASGFLNPLELLDTLFALGRYELIPFIAGALIAAWGTWRNDPLITFLAYWFACAMLLLYLHAGVADNLIMIALPSYFLIGAAFQKASDQLYARERFQHEEFISNFSLPLVGVGITLFVIGSVNFGRYARSNSLGIPLENPHFFLAAFCLLMLLFLIVSVYLFDPAGATYGFFAILIAGIFVFNWGIGWRLAHTNANDPRERWVDAATDSEVFLMETILGEAGRDLKGIDQSLVVFSTIDHPVLRWNLRAFPLVTFGDVVPIGSIPDAVITLEGEDPALSSDYTGTDFGFLLANEENVLSNRESLRWWLFGESPNAVDGTRVILWVRADLINERLQ